MERNDNSGHKLNLCLEPYLGQQWAKKYLQTLKVKSFYEDQQQTLNFNAARFPSRREKTARKLLASVGGVSLQAWGKTELLLSDEIKRHQIDPELINPWEITADAFKIYKQVVHLYTQQVPSQKLSALKVPTLQTQSISKEIFKTDKKEIASTELVTTIIANVRALRKKYTHKDPRVIAVVSMLFHNINLGLLHTLSPWEQTVFQEYLKVIGDHLYIPWDRICTAAAGWKKNSDTLVVVQKLLSRSTQIAAQIYQKVIHVYPHCRSLSGYLNDPQVKISCVRDIELFQVYLWICAPEESISAIQQELFPVCVMLYPRLGVEWELIRCMLHFLEQEICQYLCAQQARTLMPYLQVLWHMFSPKVFSEFILDR